MKLSIADLPLLRWNLAAFFLSALLGASILYGCQSYAKKTKNALIAAQNLLNEARNGLAMAREDQENMGKYAHEYDALLLQRIIGDDQRLDWMEGMKSIRRNSPVLSFSYQIAPQMLYTQKPAVDSGNFDINYSEMKLHFELLHELQLLNFFAALREHIKGHYHLESCTIQRQDPLKAECSGGWITLKKRNKS
jgi:hypothetical protein